MSDSGEFLAFRSNATTLGNAVGNGPLKAPEQAYLVQNTRTVYLYYGIQL